MKSTFKNLVLLTTFFVMATAAMPKVKNRIVGNYALVKATTNGAPNNKLVMDRTMKFNKDQTFSGAMTMQMVEKPFNQGLYFIGNDSILIMHQSMPDGTLRDIAYVYNYKFSGDTLRLKGYYTMGTPQNPNVLLKFHLDESWKKIGRK